MNLKKITKAALAVAGVILFASCSFNKTPYPAQRFKTSAGTKIDVYYIHHGTLAISMKNYTIMVDPVLHHSGVDIDYSKFPKADLILITHSHADHLDTEAIKAVKKDGARIISNVSTANEYGFEGWFNGKSKAITDAISLRAMPAYNYTEGHENFHPKGDGNGYLIQIEDFVIYIAGDSEDIPEMSQTGKTDIAFLPVNQPYTMTPEQCLKAAKTIQPKVLIPYHMGDTDTDTLFQLLRESLPNTDVRYFESLK